MAKPVHGNPNLGVLTAPQQLAPGKFKVSSIARFKPKIMCHLLRPHLLVVAQTNWATLASFLLLIDTQTS